MKPETSQLLCALFALTNFLLYSINDNLLNLCVGIAMCVSVLLLEFLRKTDA
jgi:hypothetical protein